MFSNDKNIETIGQLVEVLKHYIGLQTKYAKLDVIDKIVRILTASAMIIILSALFIFAIIYLSFAAAYAMAPTVGTVASFCIVAGIYFFVFVLCILFRKQWIEKPLVRFLASILLQD